MKNSSVENGKSNSRKDLRNIGKLQVAELSQADNLGRIPTLYLSKPSFISFAQGLNTLFWKNEIKMRGKINQCHLEDQDAFKC